MGDYYPFALPKGEIEFLKNAKAKWNDKISRSGIQNGYYTRVGNDQKTYLLKVTGATVNSVMGDYYHHRITNNLSVKEIGVLREGVKGYFSTSETKFKCYIQYKNIRLHDDYSDSFDVVDEVAELLKNCTYVGNNIRFSSASGFTDRNNEVLNCEPYFEGSSPLLSNSPMSGGFRRNPMLHLNVHRLKRHSRKSSSRRRSRGSISRNRSRRR